MSRLLRRKGTVDRLVDGVAVVLVEEGGETVEELYIDEKRLPAGVGRGEKVALIYETPEYAGSKNLLVVAAGAAVVFVGSVLLATAPPSLPAVPAIDLPSEALSTVATALLGVSVMSVGVRAALPSLERLLKLHEEPDPGASLIFSIERLDDETDNVERRTVEKVESLRSRGKDGSKFETDGGSE